jgi:hypothetical protein
VRDSPGEYQGEEAPTGSRRPPRLRRTVSCWAEASRQT